MISSSVIRCRAGLLRRVLDGPKIQGLRKFTVAGDPSKLNYVNGHRDFPANKENYEHFENINPSTGKPIGILYSSGPEEIEKAVKVAKEGFESWSETKASIRGKTLHRAADIIRKNKGDIARVEVMDTGKCYDECIGDIESAADGCDYFGGYADKLHGSYIQLPDGAFAYTRKEPIGVCAGIGAWNFPFLNFAWKVAPALCCGNSVIYKPSPLSPLSSIIFAEILTDAGVPAGAVNVVQGGALTGELLCKNADVRKVSFTGSVETGAKISSACAGGIKGVTLELGGKSPLVVFEDADLESAVRGALLANYVTQGEVCSNASRVFVEESIYDEFIHGVVKKVSALRVGDPLNATSHLGAMISEDHLLKVLSYIQSARDEGATVLYGGERIHLPEPDTGYFMSPCVIINCHDNMKIMKEEHFGPIMCITSFKNEDEVLTRANATTFGLAGGVYTKDISRAHRFVSKLQAGICYVNTYNMYPAGIPLGGFKMSGVGKENGLEALNHYYQLKMVYVETGETDDYFA